MTQDLSTLVFGRTGQVATELARLNPDLICLGREQADLSSPDRCAAVIQAAASDVVINAAAYTAVDKAEDDRSNAFLINAEAPGAMAQACAALNIPLVHISTDYVFDGTGNAPRTPDAETGPLGVYGASKLAGEEAIRAAGTSHAILRTSWVFSAHGDNFVKTMLRLGGERDHLTIVADQIGGPTPAADIAAACLRISHDLCRRNGASGTYHFSGAPDASWADFAREIFAQSGQEVTVEDIPTTAFPTPAERPLNSRLDCTTTQDVFGLQRPDWRTGLQDVLQTLKMTKA